MTEARLFIYTYKDGLLAKLAHDLRLSIPAKITSAPEGKLNVALQLDQLQVDGVMRQGALQASELNDGQRADILKNAHESILESAKHPQVVVTGQASKQDAQTISFRGELSFKGKTQPISSIAKLEGGVWRAKLEITPSTFGVAPFKALAGAIKLKDRWTIELEHDTLPEVLEG